jgi:hypothetical protein
MTEMRIYAALKEGAPSDQLGLAVKPCSLYNLMKHASLHVHSGIATPAEIAHPSVITTRVRSEAVRLISHRIHSRFASERFQASNTPHEKTTFIMSHCLGRKISQFGRDISSPSQLQC